MTAPDRSENCMVALYPPLDVAKALAVDDGLPPEKMHVTIAYCGKADDVDADALRDVTSMLAERQPFTASISGHARFTGDDQDVIVAIVDSPDLEDLRRDALNALQERGIEVPRNHAYVAHMTITYLDKDTPSPVDRLELGAVEFTALSTKHSDDRTDYPLEHPIAAPTREAFAAGWAVSGGPMTDRIRAASVAAVQTAIERADDPRILEVTIDLGKLEGMWALLFQRREEQQAKHTAVVSDVWRELIHQATAAAMVDRFRQELGLAEADHDRPGIAAAALGTAKAMLRTLADLAGWSTLRSALRDAIAAGRAEGMVNAVAIAAEQAGTIGLDWNIAFKDAYQSLERLDELWGEADGWLGQMVDRAAGDLGRTLARAAEDGASRDEMINAAMEVLASDDLKAVAFVVDWAMTTAAARGALDLYGSEGVVSVDWISAGDGRVCTACLDNESGSPWPIAEFPPMPSHPVCRCVPAADVSIAHFADWFA
ncbi:2'-5' RNA ligase family protein [Streptomyces mirabilis]|uniref:2'-5' RNA ligase family protein n=1 Tax=Streptomyces mirabilis TaxID=68239 RepID=UPI003698690A